MRQPDSLTGGSATTGAWLPSVPGILTADQILATGHSIAAVQQRDGAIGWPDGHVDAWNHVECAMALSVCGLRDAAAARLRVAALATQRPDGSWPKLAEGGAPPRPARPRATTPPTRRWGSGTSSRSPATMPSPSGCGRPCGQGIEFALGLQTAARRDHLAAPRGRHARRLRAADRQLQHAPRAALRDRARRVPRSSRSRTGSSRPTSSATRWPATRRRSPTRAGSRWTGTTRCSAARCAGEAARDRLAAGWDTFVVPGLGVRCVSDRALGDRRRDLRARARAGRDRRPRPGRLTCSSRFSTCATRTAPTGPAGSSPTGPTSRTSRAAGRRRRSSWPPTPCPGRPAGRESSPRPRRGGSWARRWTGPRAGARTPSPAAPPLPSDPV